MKVTETNLVEIASSWCASHGVLMGARVDRNNQTEAPSRYNNNNNYYYQPAPFSLYPTPFSKTAFETAYRMAKPFNGVVHKVASSDWLQQAIAVAAQGDKEFTGKLVNLANEVLQREQRGIPRAQKVVLGILRSDYMLHGPDSLETAIPLQVELNTIASSFGCLSSKLTQLHQHLQHLTQTNYELPDNGAAHGIAKGLAMALEEYHRQTRSSSTTTTTTTTTPAVVVMVVQPGETNSCDQRELEFLLLEHHGVRLIRRTLLDLATTTIEGNDAGGHALLLKGNNNNNDTETETDDDEVVEVGVVYYRAGYTPNDYPTELEWMGRSKVEHSAAIKCPDVFYHIVGAKKVQQALAEPGALRLFCESDSEEEDEGLLSSCFAGLYALGEGEDPSTVPMALANPHSYVLKPQREGGGNNLYDDALVEALTTMTHTERGAYILMDKILPPSSPGSLVRGGTIVYNADCVCELGVFGVTLREYGTDRILMNEAVGHILRAKSVLTDEGGVAAGYAFLSSPKLV